MCILIIFQLVSLKTTELYLSNFTVNSVAFLLCCAFPNTAMAFSMFSVRGKVTEEEPKLWMTNYFSLSLVIYQAATDL